MTDLTRRSFLQGSAVAAGAVATGGLVVGCASPLPPAPSAGDAVVSGFDAWLHITNDDRILLYSDKVEMGQGTFTAFATLVAEELEVDPQRIEVRHAPANDAFKTPLQSTGGSNSVAARFIPLRESGARARLMLIAAAAERWNVDPLTLRTEGGAVHHAASQRRARYGELAEDAARQKVPGEVTLKSKEEFRWIGAEFPRVDAAVKARGQTQYGIDTQVAGLLTAVVVRPPVRGGRVTSFDAAGAMAVPGVEAVFEVPTGVAVLATNYWRARKGAAVVAAKFELPGGRRYDSAEMRVEHERLLREEDGDELRHDGNVHKALDKAPVTLDVEYHTTYQPHATMEPMNCTVVPGAEHTDVYIGTQTPGIVQDVVADILGLARDEVVVHTEFLGGGFGRRFFPDVPAEAAEVAKRAGAPIKLVYSREDDIANDYYRPATAHRLRGGVNADGAVTAWDHHLVAPSLIKYMVSRMGGAVGPAWLRGTLNAVAGAVGSVVPRMMGPILSHEGAEDHPYAIENVRVASTLWDPGIYVGIWRSVGHSNNGFVVESFIDELAHAAGADPASFRRGLLSSHPRHLAVLDLVVEKSGWEISGSKISGDRSQGIAVYESFGTVVAEVAEVSVSAGQIRVEKVTCAVHCGTAVNPDVVRAQIEGGVIYGLTAAIKSQVTFRDGIPVESNFHDIAMLRMDEAPEIAVHIVPSDDPPTGVGEPGTPPIAAAVANAVFAATGQRLRELPLRLATATS